MAVLKHALGPGFTSVVPNGFVFCTFEWWCMCICFHAHMHGFECMCILPFFSFPSTVSTQSQRLWDYQSPFVFRREPSWLGGGLRWEPSGLYSKQFPLRLPCPLHIVTKAIYFKGRRNSNFMWCACVCICKTHSSQSSWAVRWNCFFMQSRITKKQIMLERLLIGCNNH